MIVAIVIYASILLLSGLLALVSYVERLYSESGKFLTRDFQENIEAFENLVEPELSAASGRASLAISLLVQFSTATITLLVAYLVFSDLHSNIPDVIQAIVGIVLVVIICNRLLPYVMFTRTSGSCRRSNSRTASASTTARTSRSRSAAARWPRSVTAMFTTR